MEHEGSLVHSQAPTTYIQRHTNHKQI